MTRRLSHDLVSRFPRRDLLKAGGALLVAFSLPAPTLANDKPANSVPANGPDPSRLDSWLVVHADTTATIFIGKTELGQGNTTALLQIAAEELDLAMHQVSAARLDTAMTPDQGATVSSSSVAKAGPRIRAACAEARQLLLDLASRHLGVTPAVLTVNDGEVSVSGEPTKSVRYGTLLGDQPFGIAVTGHARQKSVDSYKLVGTRVRRVDLYEKLAGSHVYMQNVRVPDMLHGRVVRPTGQGAYGTTPKVISIDESPLKTLGDVRVIRKGDFVGVVATQEWHAVKAARLLQVTWQMPDALPGDAALHRTMQAAKTDDSVVLQSGDVDAACASAAHVATARYEGPYQAHGPFAPNCAIANVATDSALVMCSTQDIYGTRAKIATVLGRKPDQVRVQYYEGSGTYGNSCYHDVAQAAALLSAECGRPVRVQFSRGDEMGWDNFGPAHVAQLRAAADAHGKLLAYEYHGWQHGWITVEPTEQAALGTPAGERTTGTSIPVNKTNCGAMYDIPSRRLINHHISIRDGYLRGSYLRSPLDLSFSFASEQTIDALANRLGMDPVAFRRMNISDPRWLGVLEAVVAASNWQARPQAAKPSEERISTGWGVGLGTHLESYGAAIAEVEVDRTTGHVVAKHLFGAMDAGFVVNPANVENQIVGMMVQATSRVLKETVRFDRTQVTSLDWQSYPVLRFAEHPTVTPIVVQRLDQPSTGAGEEVMGATAAAIANAVFHATGVRMQQYPMTPARVKAAIAASKGI